MWNDWGRNLVTFINVWFCVDVVFNLDLYEVVRMTEKRFKMKKLEYESYFIDSQQEYIDKDEPNFEIDGEKTMSDSQILDLLNENEELKEERDYFERKKCEYFKKYNKKHLDNIQLKEENDKLNAIDFKTDCVRLEKENEQLKQKIKFINEILNEDIGYIESFRKIEEVLKWLKNDLH